MDCINSTNINNENIEIEAFRSVIDWVKHHINNQDLLFINNIALFFL